MKTKAAKTTKPEESMSSPERHHPLSTFFAPRSVAVIGATDSKGSVGRAVLENLRPFTGQVLPVNPHRKTVFRKICYPKVSAIPEPPDLVVIATPASTVPGIIRECVDAGVSGAIVLSAGFKESGAAGSELERQILMEARRGSLRVLGPNCLGLMLPHIRLNATFARSMAKPGRIAFLSQSGALCTAILDWSFRENVGFSGFVSIGSMVDVGWSDLLYHFGDDPHTKSIVCYMESVGDARGVLSAAREVALTKPIIVLKVGHTEAAAKAAASHTGALTGSDAVLDAAFRRVGVLRVATLGELFDMAEVLAKQPRSRGPRLAIVTNAGGPGALATDMLVSSGGQLAPLLPDTIQALNAFLPPAWSHGNPIDILGDADSQRYAKAVELAANDPQTDGVCVILTPQAMIDAKATAKELCRCARKTTKPILASWMGASSVDSAKAILNAGNIPTFDTPDTAARAFALMWQYSENLRALYETPSLGESSPTHRTRLATARRLIAKARRSRRTLLTEVESKQLLAAYDIPTVESRVALNENEAVKQARDLGFPVVVKILSKTLTHKSDVGGVQLNLHSAAAVRRAWRTIFKNVSERAGHHHFIGVTVQPMMERNGCELILGSSVDPQFGPVLLFGAGGKFVEVFHDTVLGLPPLNGTLARRLMERTRIFGALGGARGETPVDLEALAQLLVRFSQLVAEQPLISEIDVNPLLASSDGLVALDARVVLQPDGIPEAQLPRLAIQPYPSQYVTRLKLKDGRTVIFRPIRPEDEQSMVTFHQTLSDRSIYLRYFTPLKLEERVAHERLSRICFIDYDREMALVVEYRNARTGRTEIVGVGRLSRSHGANEAEFALLVLDTWQGQAIGTQLLNRLVDIGRDAKLERITASMLAENSEMRHVARRAGFKVARGPDGYTAVLVL